MRGSFWYSVSLAELRGSSGARSGKGFARFGEPIRRIANIYCYLLIKNNISMKTAFETACDAYHLRKEAEHRARLRALQLELVHQWPLASASRPAAAATPPRRSRAQAARG